MIKKTFLGIMAKFFKYRSFLLRNQLKTINVWGYSIVANRDHSLPIYLRNRPSYASNFPRLLLAVKKKYSDFTLVDIGANIGDTVALVRSKIDCRIVCIEGEDFYYRLLLKNIAQFKNVYAIRAFLGEKKETIAAKKENSGGTLSFFKTAEHDKSGNLPVEISTLDILSKENIDFFRSVRVVKIDTDGYDLKIIRGGLSFISDATPILFFEYDRFFLERAGDEGLAIFERLAGLGYTKVLFFDNVGRFVISLDVKNSKSIEELYSYTYRKKGSFPFYDICVFHSSDEDIAISFVNDEVKINHENTI